MAMAAMAGTALVDVSNVHALCEALLQRLLPEIKALVEEVAASVASRTVQTLCQTEAANFSQQGATVLGALQPGRAVSVDWTFTNSGSSQWPAGARLRFLAGSLGPPPSFAAAATQAPTLPGSVLTAEAAMVAPQEPGPCEAHWQLEGADGLPLSPPLRVQGMVVAASLNSQLDSTAQAVPQQAPKQAAALWQGAAQPEQLLPRACAGAARAGTTASAPSGGPLQGTAAVHRIQQVPLAAHVRSAGYPVQAAPADAWPQAFEEFFGRDVLVRLRQTGSAEQQRMLTQVWDHLKRRGLCRTGADGHGTDGIMVDEVLARLYGPALAPGTGRVRTSDILPLTQQIIARYKECKGAA